MEFLFVLEDYRVLVCSACQFVVNHDRLAAHLRTRHAHHLEQSGRTAVALANACAEQLRVCRLPVYGGAIRQPTPDSPPLPGLAVQNGYGCSLCPAVRREESGIRAHFTQKHPYRRKRGEEPWSPVLFQQFTRCGSNKIRFRVRPLSFGDVERAKRAEDVKACHIRSRYQDRVLADLELAESTLQARALSQSALRLGSPQPSEVSPWLEATRWHQYLRGHSLIEVASLAKIFDPVEEPLLRIICDSLDRVVRVAYNSVCEDKINAFDQLRINTFQSKGGLFARPLLVKLQHGTYRAYIYLWKRLLCFAFRSTRPDQRIVLAHVLTDVQRRSLTEALQVAREVQLSTPPTDFLMARMDRVCLWLCVSLLDHQLRGSLFESVVLGFLAVLGIDPSNATLQEAYSYTPVLSRFIKISQLLILQRAVSEVEEGRAEYPSDLLEEMCGRFMLDNTASPLAWAIRLRALGKKMMTSTTAQGFITWSEDRDVLNYKDLTLKMSDFRAFVTEQVQKAQSSLRRVLLLHEEEEFVQVMPRLPLGEVKDNPANVAPGWCFLYDQRNQHIFEPGDKWLIKRILGLDWLQQEFVRLDDNSGLSWKVDSIRAYHKEVARFLELLLLVVHLTAGQPARGTELMSLRYLNSSFHRNIFVEHGLIATVTSYHKGYSIQGSTKIIHRYLPRPVSEMVVYYLWLVIPFQRHLHMLAGDKSLPAYQPWLWSSYATPTPWESASLRSMLQQQSGKKFSKELNIQIYRQIAIAISRTHLASGGFKLDYGIEQKAIDAQAAHESNLAGSIYARGLQQARGQIEARQAIFRAVSREWHEFLGFCVPLGPRKRGFGQVEAYMSPAPPAKSRKLVWQDIEPIIAL